VLFHVIRTYLYVPYGFRKLTRTGAFAGSAAGIVQEQPPAAGSRLKRALWRHYVKQYHEASCSVASVATVVNALGEVIAGRPGEITQMDLLDRVTTGNWKKRMSPEGDNGRRGLPLALFGEVVRGSLEALRIPFASVETIDTRDGGSRDGALAGEGRETLRKRLLEFETQGNGVIIAHFDQGAFVPELNIPHISPVGGYDDATGRVTVLDVDRFQNGPYSIPLERFYRGMSRPYPLPFRLLGLTNGGYVYIRLR